MYDRNTLNEPKTFEIISQGKRSRIPLIVHIPHSSVFIPEDERLTFFHSELELNDELLRMTDRYTDDLFSDAVKLGGTLFVNRVSRLVCDPERFPDDESEPMSIKGMGAVYTKTSEGNQLKVDSFGSGDKSGVMNKYFHPYSKTLEEEVTKILEAFGKCFIIDGHSFPSIPLPYEDPNSPRPDICFGYDPFHAPNDQFKDIEKICKSNNYGSGHNEPFSGSYVPLKYFEKESKVKSLMIEIRRGTYMNESNGSKSQQFNQTKNLISEIMSKIVSTL
jgi:N-formylglutamate deformylase